MILAIKETYEGRGHSLTALVHKDFGLHISRDEQGNLIDLIIADGEPFFEFNFDNCDYNVEYGEWDLTYIKGKSNRVGFIHALNDIIEESYENECCN